MDRRHKTVIIFDSRSPCEQDCLEKSYMLFPDPKLTLVVFSVASILGACASTPQERTAVATTPAADISPSAPQEETAKMPATPWEISFADGSANLYRFWQDSAEKSARFDYAPVQTAESSSGTYSGGTAKSGELSTAEVDSIWAQVDTMRIDQNLHAETRMMGTGGFVMHMGGEEHRFIVKNGPELNAFMSTIKPFAGQ